MTQQEENEIFVNFGETGLQFVKTLMERNKQDLVQTLASNMKSQEKTINRLEAQIAELTTRQERLNDKIKMFFEVF